MVIIYSTRGVFRSGSIIVRLVPFAEILFCLPGGVGNPFLDIFFVLATRCQLSFKFYLLVLHICHMIWFDR